MPTTQAPPKKAYITRPGTVKVAAPKAPKAIKPQANGRFITFIDAGRRSKGAKGLADAFSTTKNVADFVPSARKDVDFINWGVGNIEHFYGYHAAGSNKLFNDTTPVNLCRNKLKFFEKMSNGKDGPRIPQFVKTLDEAKALIDKGEVVFGRKVTGSCGTDIALFEEEPDKFASSDFWTVYKKKKHEFRVHCFKFKDGAEVIDIQQKTLRLTDPVTNQPIDKTKVNFMVRNHKNGFIFQRHDITVPEDVREQALKAFKLSGLHFGAVDVIWNEHEAKAYVLEINTAPGLEGTTHDNYVSAFKRLTA